MIKNQIYKTYQKMFKNTMTRGQYTPLVILSRNEYTAGTYTSQPSEGVTQYFMYLE